MAKLLETPISPRPASDDKSWGNMTDPHFEIFIRHVRLNAPVNTTSAEIIKRSGIILEVPHVK